MNTRQDIENYLINEGERPARIIKDMSAYELLDEYLEYNGISGFTDDILNAVQAVYESVGEIREDIF